MTVKTTPQHPLELGGAEMRRMVDRAMDHIVAHLEALGEAPAAATDGGRRLARSLAEPLPETGAPFEELLELVFERALPCSFNNPGPGFVAFIPGGGLFHTAVADLIAGAVNRYVTVWAAAPGLVQLESNVVRWLCQIVGYPPTAGGILTSGGSLANLVAVVTARAERLPEDFLAGTLYTSDQAHHSVAKAALVAGFPRRNLRQIPADGELRLSLPALAERVAADRLKGRRPFLVVASAGTTNTGAVDDLAALADFAAAEGLWLHVDAAYGGFFALTARGRRALAGLERADSVTVDPHKGLFLPYGTGALVVRDPGALRRTHHLAAAYMPPIQDDPELVDFCELSPELSRSFRGLRVWLPIKMHGIDAFRRSLDEKLDLARWAAAELRRVPGLEVLADPVLSLVVFRLVLPHLDAAEENARNRELLARINRRQRVFLTATTLPGDRFALRICVLSFRTHRERMEMALEDIRQATAEVRGT